MNPSSKRYQVLAIVGQTATGKSDLAVAVAQKIGAEIISADSRQVYKELNLGAGKITEEEMRGVPHHLLDVCDLHHTYSVAEFADEAHHIIDTCIERNSVPIVCGGTGQYVDAALTCTTFPRTVANVTFRKSLETFTPHELYEKLLKADPRRAEKIDRHNRVRLIRALEIIHVLGKVPEMQTPQDRYTTLRIGLYAPIDILRKRIIERLEKRIAAGMIDEVRAILASGISEQKLYDLGLEYRYTVAYITNKMSYEEYLNILSTKIGQFAKRQMTWFKRNPDIIWYDISNTDQQSIAADILKKWR